MKALEEFDIPFVGLKEDTHSFDYNISRTFFDLFEFDEFNDSNVRVKLNLTKKTTLLELDFKGAGHINVNCDLTNEPYDQKVESNFNLVVKFGETFNDENEDILIIPRSEFKINVAQYIYEMIVLNVPTKRVHPGVLDGTLDSDVLKKLEELAPKEEEHLAKDDVDPRWNELKKLLTDK